MIRHSCVLFLCFLFLFPLIVTAEVETISVTHKYVMGDNDSKNDARRMCFLEAKRKVLAKAGAYIQSRTTIKNYQLTEDEITAYSAALLKIETVKEDWAISGVNMSVTMKVKADVDASILEKQLAKIQQDQTVQKKIKAQSTRLLDLEKTVNELRTQLGSAGGTKEPVLRKKRNIVFKQIDYMEKKQIIIVEKVRKKTRDAKTLIVVGMSRGDVTSLIGYPDSGYEELHTRVMGSWGREWHYGTTKIYFNTHEQAAVVKRIY